MTDRKLPDDIYWRDKFLETRKLYDDLRVSKAACCVDNELKLEECIEVLIELKANVTMAPKYLKILNNALEANL